MRYNHTQTAPLFLILLAVGIGMFVGAWLMPDWVGRSIMACSGGLMIFLAFCFRQLTVRDEGDRLLISFGPIPVFRRSIKYSDLATVEKGRTTLLDGWGIHLSPSGGWTWNLWGFDCVDVRYRKGSRVKRIRIGTDDLVGLEAFLKEQTNTQANGASATLDP